MPKYYRLKVGVDGIPVGSYVAKLVGGVVDPGEPPVDPTPGNPELVARSIEFGIPAGYPRFETTGVPDGTVMTVSAQDYNITTDTTLENLEIQGTVKANGCNVILRRCRIVDTASYKVTTSNGGTILLEDCEVDGNGGGGAIGVGHDNITLKRCYVHHCVDGIRPTNNCLIEDCLVVDSVDNEAQNHVDCLQMTGGLNVTIRHNTLLSWRQEVNGRSAWGNAAIGLGCETNRLKDVLIENNYLSGGNSTVFIKNPTRFKDGAGAEIDGAAGIQYDMENIVFRNNEFRGDFRSDPSAYTDITVREAMRSTTAAVSANGANNIRFYGNFSTLPQNRTRPDGDMRPEGVWRNGSLRVLWQADIGNRSGVITVDPELIGLPAA